MNPWLQFGLPLLAGLLTAGGALIGVRRTVRGNDRATEQRELAARREEWWRRFTWAAELALDDDTPARQLAGLQLLTTLADSDLAQRDDCLLLDVFHRRLLDTLLDDSAKHEEGRAEL